MLKAFTLLLPHAGSFFFAAHMTNITALRQQNALGNVALFFVTHRPSPPHSKPMTAPAGRIEQHSSLIGDQFWNSGWAMNQKDHAPAILAHKAFEASPRAHGIHLNTLKIGDVQIGE